MTLLGKNGLRRKSGGREFMQEAALVIQVQKRWGLVIVDIVMIQI